MLHLFAPENTMARPASAKAPAQSVTMVAGETYDIDPAWAKKLNGLIDGKDGKPALIAVEADAAEVKPVKPAKGKAAPVNPAPGVEVT